MAEWRTEAGLAGKNSHGVRKAAATRMAERGTGTHALMATFGWLDIKQAQLCTREVERKGSARENAHRLGTNQNRNPSLWNPHHPLVREKAGKKDQWAISVMVPQEGLEPPHPCEYQILSLARLPVPPLGHEPHHRSVAFVPARPRRLERRSRTVM